MDLTFRTAEDADATALHRIYTDPMTAPHMGFDPCGPEDFAPIFEALRAGDALTVCESGGRVAGAYRTEFGARRVSHVARFVAVALAPEAAGKGIGAAMMRHAIGAAVGRGASRLELTVAADNTRAIAFWRRLGFEVEGRFRRFFSRRGEPGLFDELAMALLPPIPGAGDTDGPRPVTGFDAARDLPVLERTPGVLSGALRGLDDRLIRSDRGPGSWSPLQVVAHFLHNELNDWIPRVRWIMERGEREPFPAYDPAGNAGFESRTLDDLLDSFAAARAASLAELRPMLSPETLALRGVHPAFGAVTMDQMLCAWVAHDLHHLAQIARAVAREHTENVGPWRGYISIVG